MSGRAEREIEEANGVITSIHPRWQQHREREGRAKPPPATPPSTNLKTIFDVAAARRRWLSKSKRRGEAGREEEEEEGEIASEKLN